MLDIFRGTRPDITPAQTAAIVAALAQLLRAFGIYDLAPEQQDAINVACGMLLAVVLGDVGLRAARNSADAKRDAAAISATTRAQADATGIDDEHDALMRDGEVLPDDEEEFAAPPPGDPVVQPSQIGMTPTPAP